MTKPHRKPYRIGKVRENLTRKVQAAVTANPCSLRELARQAGVSHVLLLQIVGGTQQATRSVAENIATALQRWATDCGKAAKAIRSAARKVPTPRTRGTQ